MSCLSDDCLSDDVLADLEGGELDVVARLAAEEHLRACDDCRAQRDDLAGVLALVGELAAEELAPVVAKESWAAVAARIEAPVRVRVACTYCKGALDDAKVYCAECLAPHHEDCWEGACAACRATGLVRAERRVPIARRSRAGFALAAFAAAALGAGVAALALRREPIGGAPGPRVPAPTPVFLPSRPADRVLRTFHIGASRTHAVFRKSELPGPVYVDGVPATFTDESGRPTLAIVTREACLHAATLGNGALPSGWLPQPVGPFGDPPFATCEAREGLVTASFATVRLHRKNCGVARWTVELASPVVASPALDAKGNLVLVPTASGEVVALEVATGRERWRASLLAPACRPIAAVPGASRALVATLDGRVTVLDSTDGRILSWVDVEQTITGGPVAAAALSAWVGTSDGRVIALRLAANGRIEVVARRTATLGPARHLVLRDEGRSVVFATATSVRHASETEVDRALMEERDVAGLVVRDERVIAVSTRGLVSAVDLATGGLVWSLQLENEKNPVSIESPPVLSGSELIVIATDGRVAVIDTR